MSIQATTNLGPEITGDLGPEIAGEILTVDIPGTLPDPEVELIMPDECLGETRCSEKIIRPIGTLLCDVEHVRFQLKLIERNPLEVIESALRSYTHVESRTAEVKDDITLCGDRKSSMLAGLNEQRLTTDYIVTKLVESKNGFTEEKISEIRELIAKDEVETDEHFDAALDYMSSKVSGL